ncbi:hypothetical protein FRACYDRAFT_253518 [Fragilariopsis cylindrus CCMP1102]|uniref:Uncharacterized protein n=1 Tax=Fragilariopsis cylindrus CCMP1102 TaxID=635003 RepID=A0A1E7ELG0_9STRA|nr:hypothetical protein FRACYDRAFT_253518 [Fragilariopsis cylindrus CCMP1102]|eukprot:OEU06748.1 hypothetical protein FRACYDRAFT_253518 [Fragilariopsis cylindrus CCMP1102]
MFSGTGSLLLSTLTLLPKYIAVVDAFDQMNRLGLSPLGLDLIIIVILATGLVEKVFSLTSYAIMIGNKKREMKGILPKKEHGIIVWLSVDLARVCKFQFSKE